MMNFSVLYVIVFDNNVHFLSLTCFDTLTAKYIQGPAEIIKAF